MNLEYLYCSHCGMEYFDIFAAYSRPVANGDLYLCPDCGEETNNIEIDLENNIILTS